MADPTDLPTEDEFFGAPAKPKAELPTEDEFFAPGPLDRAWAAFGDLHKGAANEISAVTGVGEQVPTGPAIDEFFHKTSLGRVMRSFGQGMEQGWGAGPVGLGPDTERWLKEVGLFNDYEVGQKSFVKSFNESLIRPAVAGLDVVGMRLPGAVLGALVQTTEKIPVVGPVISTGIEAVSDPGVQATMLGAGPLGAFGALGSAWLARGRPVTLPEARSLGVIGEGEAGWKGTKGLEDPKIAQQRMVEAYREWDDLIDEQPPSAAGPRPGEATPGNPALAVADAADPIPDVHQVARQIAPQVFERYDALEQQADTFRRWIDELAEARAEQPKVKDLQTEIDGILGKVKGVEDRLTKTAAARLEAARAELDTALKTDTPDMARVRQELLKNDFARRDMAEDVSGAYRQARDVLPPEAVPEPVALAARADEDIPAEAARPSEATPGAAVTPEQVSPTTAETAAPPTRAAPDSRAPVPESAPRSPGEPINIAEDVAQKIVAAGRPAEEAQAASQIIASHYEARAARLGLTADELYREEMPDIRTGGRQTAREMELAQKKGRTLNQDEPPSDKNLFVVHNIKPDGVLNADKIGGLPMPSLAIARTDRGGFENFGVISLIGDRNMVNPKVDRAAKITNTDAYSPRYPTVKYEFDHKKLEPISKEADAAVKEIGGGDRYNLSTDRMEDRGLSEAQYERALQALFIKEKGELPSLKKADGTPDFHENMGAIDKLIREKYEDEFAGWVREKMEPTIKRERIFKGFTNSGTRRYIEHTLENAYADMKSRIKEGEGFNYGVGSIRSRWSKVFKDITGVEKARDAIVTEAEIKQVKEAFDKRFFELAEEMKPHYRFDAKGFSYFDDTSQMLAEMAQKGARVLDEGFENLPKELVEKVRQFGADLASAPTAYFEVKLNRPVKLQEFRGALVPDGTPKRVVDALEKHGLEIHYYDPKVEGSRLEALNKMHEAREAAGESVLFQAKRGTATFRDGQATIRLFKDADASTVMHETGHVWLEELLKDAVDSRAVQAVRDDAAAVRKWLGAEDGAEITTKQHEKFARGFERYLMEGRAPTKELASVFEQFKQWLTDIYQTVQKLRAPITDEIREVFDRLIAVEPREAVIADDMKRGPSFAEIHKADAESTPPARAAEAADRIREETAEITRQRLPEMYDELYPDGTFGRGPDQGPNIAGQGDAAGPVAGADGNPAAPGGVGPRGSEPPGEGPGARQGEPAKPIPEPVTANDQIPRSETQLVDKAGNIRIDNLNVPDDVAAAIRQAADDNDGFMAARRGVMSDAQALELADSLGMSPETLNMRKIGEAFNAEQIWAARKLLVESATNVRDAMAKAAGGTDADVMAYAEMKARHQMIQEQVAGITAEAGRALRAFRAMEGMTEATEIGAFLEQSTGKTLFQLKREAQLGMKLDTPQKVSKFVNDSKRAKFTDMILEFWINALLSGPTTHVKNIVGNMAVAVNRVVETGVAGALGSVRRAAGIGPEGGVLAGEAKAAMFGILQGAKDGVKAGAKAFMDEEVLLKGNHSVEQRKYQAIPSAKINVMGRELEIGGRQVRIPGRFLGAQDEFFKAIAHRQELNTLAYREATEAGLTGDAFKQRLADIVTNPSDAQMEAAQKAAGYQTFTQSLGPTGRALQSLANSNPLLKVVIPFIRTPTNILKYAYERTPVAAINPWGDMGREIRANLSGVNGGAAMDTQMARLAVGTMLGTAFMAMALEGDVTGGGPSDPRERAMLKDGGWQPYSLKIGESYYAYDWLDPFATIMGVSADLAETGERALEEDPELGKVAAMLFGSISKNLMSKLSLRGASDLIEAVSDPDRYGEQYIRNMAGTVVPSVVGQAARAQDPVQREARTVMDQIKSRIPGLREGLFPSRNIWGEPITSEGAVGPDYGSPLRTDTISDDPVTQRMIALKLWPAKPGRTIRGVELTDQQYDDYTRTAGRLAKMRLDAIVANPQFSNAPDFVQRDIMDKMIDDSRESARTLIMAQNPAIIQAATEDKLRALRGEPDKKGPIKQPEAR